LFNKAQSTQALIDTGRTYELQTVKNIRTMQGEEPLTGTFHSTGAGELHQAYELQTVKNIRTMQGEEPLTGYGSSDK
jgi:hypothetical protein